MAFQVNSNVVALNVYNNLGAHQAKSSAALARISSGLKASGMGDVASQGASATRYAALQVTTSNINQVQNAINQLQVADSAYGEIIALGQKGLEVASRGTDPGADADAILAQVTAIKAGMDSINDNTEFNGDGWTDDFDPTVGGAALAVQPTAVTIAVTFTVADFTADIASAVELRATNAGNLASLQNTLQVLNSVAANELASVGQAQDVDIAREMMNLTSANIMTEAATAMLAQAMQLPNSVLRLVQ